MYVNLFCKNKSLTSLPVSDLSTFKIIYPKGTMIADGLNVYEVKKVKIRKNGNNELVVTYDLKEVKVTIKATKKKGK